MAREIVKAGGQPPTVNEAVQHYRAATPAMLRSELTSLRRLLSAWHDNGSEERKASRLPAVLDACADGLAPLFEPAGTKAATVLLHRLFVALPAPPADAMPIWLEMLEGYPPDVLRRAIDATIRSHKWATPPLIAEVVEFADADELHTERDNVRAKIADMRRETAADLRRDAEREEENRRQREEEERANAAAAAEGLVTMGDLVTLLGCNFTDIMRLERCGMPCVRRGRRWYCDPKVARRWFENA
jgi:hypothetical protein